MTINDIRKRHAAATGTYILDGDSDQAYQDIDFLLAEVERLKGQFVTDMMAAYDHDERVKARLALAEAVCVHIQNCSHHYCTICVGGEPPYSAWQAAVEPEDKG
jgi:hypothetical protein